MITLGFQSPNRMVVFGLNTPEVKRVYMGYSEVEKPLSGLFKEDYKKVVGEREKKYHKAGWKMGADGIRVNKDGKKLILKMLAKNESSYRRSAEVIQAQLARVGVEAKITLLDPSSIRAYYKKGEHQLAVRSYEWENADILEWFLNSKRMGYPNAAMYHDNESDYLMQKVSFTPKKN